MTCTSLPYGTGNGRVLDSWDGEDRAGNSGGFAFTVTDCVRFGATGLLRLGSDETDMCIDW